MEHTANTLKAAGELLFLTGRRAAASAEQVQRSGAQVSASLSLYACSAARLS